MKSIIKLWIVSLFIFSCGQRNNDDDIKFKKIEKLNKSKKNWLSLKKDFANYSYSYINHEDFIIYVDIKNHSPYCRRLVFFDKNKKGFKELGKNININKWKIPPAVSIEELYRECEEKINTFPYKTKVRYFEKYGFISGCTEAFDSRVSMDESTFVINKFTCDIPQTYY